MTIIHVMQLLLIGAGSLSLIGLIGIPLFIIYRQLLAKHRHIKAMRQHASVLCDDAELVAYAQAEVQAAKKRPFWKWAVTF